ncbi:O-antigen ligase domain-containing protein [Acinetobacter sp. WU_MDCI_Abxe161]|uniref:O-antigen ligase domain-containing protein n=1 Tax=Acinetobacter sp. WU_MDCI_Abxe161 TaxID=2850074 RepID=UPI0021CD3BE4|nr:O-antigen ligase domain-containing protein [Acinetobacter sp. WU_MDCI_Abxe161]
MIRLDNIKLSLLYFGSVFYIYYFTLKPVYIILGVAVFFGYLFKNYIINYSYLIVSLCFIGFLGLVSLLMKTDIGMVLNATLSILIFPIFYYCLKNDRNVKAIPYFLNLCFIYFLIEMLYRVSFPVYALQPGVEEEWFYPYKLNSFVFQDSNFVALHLFCLLYISIILKLNKYIFVFLILIFLSFSRSAMLGGVLACLYYLSVNTRYVTIIKPIFYLSTVSAFIYLILHIDMITDGSFLSKIYIIDEALTYMSNNFSLFQYLFGNGLAQTYDALGIGAHNIAVVLIFETGIIGTIIYFLYFFNFFLFRIENSRRKIAKQDLLVFLALFFLMGFSLGLYLFPIMSLTIASILALSGKKNVI